MNFLKDIPADLTEEVFETVLSHSNIRIERIVSNGHTSPSSGYYDQDENEWVLVLQGCAELIFGDGKTITLKAGDSLNIPAHQKHKVSYTDTLEPTIWLAIFY
ncbi:MULTISPECIES: cupin domain-containing protein [unclassified Pseudoalteromonas]|uniref:cupin domain-containing protein n=1 Tax=unclassified Pseudoalteromonas TaxID=194690 RepID=UPI000C7D8AD1|nr:MULTISPECIES: cupin domain-containing protein [unclassified Pseudoalteromonas]AUJ72162.1 Cupin domain protein [Pseudoalteromonas sp. NC201]MBR8845923.1 cupin domain-containing protein [Pseudoalteromonas sp. JC3]MCF2826085.1 cupin domain-containing protein [Pseudoalteromonas sp. OF5H-5]MCF2832655.1 cupin domain-containing protein [Pseudoalteromonas sp. DL2-H6]MCF2924966.1 cupin domain-containing protein [Pseudoalteromonas sp. DL2-H1]